MLLVMDSPAVLLTREEDCGLSAGVLIAQTQSVDEVKSELSETMTGRPQVYLRSLVTQVNRDLVRPGLLGPSAVHVVGSSLCEAPAPSFDPSEPPSDPQCDAPPLRLLSA